MNDIPGLPARRAALKMGDAVLRRGETLDQAAGAAMQHLRAPADRALARAIALDPELIMYDEPFAGLDPISLGTSAQLIRQLNDAMGLTSILVSHDVEETFRVADHVVILGSGGVAAQGSPDEVRASSDPLVQQFINARSTGPVPFHYPGVTAEEDFGQTSESRKRA